MTTTQMLPVEVGQVRDARLKLNNNKNTVVIPVLVVATRKVYGRVEWQVVPVYGSTVDDLWVREDGVLSPAPSTMAGVTGTAITEEGESHEQ